MVNLNNPAGRLHDLLTRYMATASTNRSIWNTWRAVFQVETDTELLPLLGQTASLLGEIKTAIDRLGEPSLLAMYDTFSDRWGQTIVSSGNHPGTTPSPGAAHVDEEALTVLAALSFSLSTLAPDGSIPDPDTVASLRVEVEEMIDALLADDSLPIEVATIVSQRMHDVLWAIDHIGLGGPGAVEAAMERLLGQIILATRAAPETRGSGIISKVLDLGGRLWWAFRSGPEVHKAIEGWEKVWEIGPGGN